ncbi:acyl-CoA thioesterase/BAAT N-terminal domain-containing protein [Candidatus Protochlamydia phocaeensis]|uniref:acyl-CoA thioesterase/BAAT N-terminal domain-containing protein n=1 Tax=Candidatus Protochlamydia phocaeensis TaxID=1414722 RepID=UPI000AEB3D49|nr:acyl-CoA thioesterase/BAAT N-terminal domain-containing protein [Candidatus Protochlamydia phocaeensis]
MIHSLCRYVCALLPCLLGVSLFVHSSDTRLPHACTQLMISSPVSLADEPVWIEVRGLAPFQIAEIQAETVDNKGEKWLSWALFEANEKGVISLSKAEPIAGTYVHADSMGLFWSMKPVSSPFDSFKMKGDWDVDLKVWVNGQITAQQSIKRLRKLPAVQKIEVREEGLVASFFLSSPFSRSASGHYYS